MKKAVMKEAAVLRKIVRLQSPLPLLDLSKKAIDSEAEVIVF
jgi:hypothetical protein